MANKKFYVTTPVYYSNAPAHVGSAYTTIAADILARWNRLLGNDVFFLTGTDEHGQNIQQTAEENGLKPKEFVDKIADNFKEAFKLLNITNDFFIRTTNPKHEKEVQKLLQELYDKKFIYKGTYESYYCIGCEQYLTKSDLIDNCCPIHKKEPELRKEEAYMFKLSAFQDELLNLIKSGKYCILPEIRRKEIISFIEGGLRDVSISRLKSKVYWGIDLPFDKNHSAWVWPDAFWNYISGLKINNKFKKFWPADIQLMAKDIIRVHATIWPALLLATENKLPKTLFVHGYFTVNGQKMSKSLGNVISPIYLVQQYGADSLRYFLIRNIPFGDDGDFSETALKDRHNNELANKLGNLVSRTAGMCKGEYKKSKVDKELTSKLKFKEISKHMENYEFDKALSFIFGYIDGCNNYVQTKQPWTLEGVKKQEVLYNLVDSIRVISILLEAFMPSTSEKIRKQFGFEKQDIKGVKFGITKSGKVEKSDILFKKIE